MNNYLKAGYLSITSESDKEFHQNSLDHGFWADILQMRACIQLHHPDLTRRFDAMVVAEKLALMHSELSEALEAVRTGADLPDRHCPDYTNLEIELADLDIRRGDLARYLGLRHGQAVLAKHEYNKTRPHKHGKQS